MKVGKYMSKVQFDEEDKKILAEELNKLQRDYLDYLADNDNDEEARGRLFVLSYLKNLIVTNVIDCLQWDDEDDKICTVDVDSIDERGRCI